MLWYHITYPSWSWDATWDGVPDPCGEEGWGRYCTYMDYTWIHTLCTHLFNIISSYDTPHSITHPPWETPCMKRYGGDIMATTMDRGYGHDAPTCWIFHHHPGHSMCHPWWLQGQHRSTHVTEILWLQQWIEDAYHMHALVEYYPIILETPCVTHTHPVDRGDGSLWEGECTSIHVAWWHSICTHLWNIPIEGWSDLWSCGCAQDAWISMVYQYIWERYYSRIHNTWVWIICTHRAIHTPTPSTTMDMMEMMIEMTNGGKKEIKKKDSLCA